MVVGGALVVALVSTRAGGAKTTAVEERLVDVDRTAAPAGNLGADALAF